VLQFFYDQNDTLRVTKSGYTGELSIAYNTTYLNTNNDINDTITLLQDGNITKCFSSVWGLATLENLESKKLDEQTYSFSATSAPNVFDESTPLDDIGPIRVSDNGNKLSELPQKPGLWNDNGNIYNWDDNVNKYIRKKYVEVPDPEQNKLALGEYNLILESTKWQNRLPTMEIGGPILPNKTFDNLVGHTVKSEPSITNTFMTHIQGWPDLYYQGKRRWLPDDIRLLETPSMVMLDDQKTQIRLPTLNDYMNNYSNHPLRNYIKLPEIDNIGNLQLYYSFTAPQLSDNDTGLVGGDEYFDLKITFSWDETKHLYKFEKIEQKADGPINDKNPLIDMNQTEWTYETGDSTITINYIRVNKIKSGVIDYGTTSGHPDPGREPVGDDAVYSLELLPHENSTTPFAIGTAKILYRPCRSDVESYKITVTEDKVQLNYLGKSPSYYDDNIMLSQIYFDNDKYISYGIKWRNAANTMLETSTYHYSFSDITKVGNTLKLKDSEGYEGTVSVLDSYGEFLSVPEITFSSINGIYYSLIGNWVFTNINHSAVGISDILDKTLAPSSNMSYKLLWNNNFYQTSTDLLCLNKSNTLISYNNWVYKYDSSVNYYKLYLDYFYSTIDSTYPLNRNASVEDIFSDVPLELEYGNTYNLFSFTIRFENVTTINYLTVNHTAHSEELWYIYCLDINKKVIGEKIPLAGNPELLNIDLGLQKSIVDVKYLRISPDIGYQDSVPGRLIRVTLNNIIVNSQQLRQVGYIDPTLSWLKDSCIVFGKENNDDDFKMYLSFDGSVIQGSADILVDRLNTTFVQKNVPNNLLRLKYLYESSDYEWNDVEKHYNNSSNDNIKITGSLYEANVTFNKGGNVFTGALKYNKDELEKDLYKNININSNIETITFDNYYAHKVILDFTNNNQLTDIGIAKQIELISSTNSSQFIHDKPWYNFFINNGGLSLSNERLRQLSIINPQDTIYMSYDTRIRLDSHTWIFDKDIYFSNNDTIDIKLMYRNFTDEKTKAILNEYYMFYRKNYDRDKLYLHPDQESQDVIQSQYKKWIKSNENTEKWTDKHTPNFWKEINRYAYENNDDTYPKGFVDPETKWVYLGKTKNNTRVKPYTNPGTLYFENFGKKETYYKNWFSQNPAQSKITDFCMRMGYLNPIVSKKDIVQGADLSNRTILNLDMRRRYLKGCKLNNTFILNSSFSNCELADVKLFNTYFDKVNLTGSSLSRANFTAIHYLNLSRPFQLNHIQIDKIKVDSVNLNGIFFKSTDKTTNELYDQNWSRCLPLTKKERQMFNVGYFKETKKFPMGVDITNLLCDELTIFSYNESIYENIFSVFIVKDITSPSPRNIPVVFDKLNEKGYPIYKPVDIAAGFPWMTDRNRSLRKIEKVGRFEWRIYGGWVPYSPEYMTIWENESKNFPTSILVEINKTMLNKNYIGNLSEFKGQRYTALEWDKGYRGIWWSVKNIIMSDFFNHKSGLFNDRKTWRYSKIPYDGNDLDDDLYQDSNYQKYIYIDNTIEIPYDYTWSNYGKVYVFGTLINKGKIRNYGVIVNLGQILNYGTIYNSYSDKILKVMQKTGGQIINGPNFAATISVFNNMGFIQNDENCYIISKHPSNFFNRKLINNYGIINVNGKFMASQMHLIKKIKTGKIINEGFINYNKQRTHE
jgi:hypothetical protein